jgi:hypothetical protein
MEYKYFLELLMTYKKTSEEISELYDIGVDLLEGKYKLSDRFYSMLQICLNSHYTKEGVEWVEWFIFENDYGQKDWSSIPKFNEETGKVEIIDDPAQAYGAKDENGNIICYSYESLWEFIKQYKK